MEILKRILLLIFLLLMGICVMLLSPSVIIGLPYFVIRWIITGKTNGFNIYVIGFIAIPSIILYVVVFCHESDNNYIDEILLELKELYNETLS